MPNQDNLRAWVQDLRTTDAKQAKGRLVDKFDDKIVGYCCLGRLCEVAVSYGVEIPHDPLFTYACPDNALVPKPVADWLEIEPNGLDHYADYNDQVGLNFVQIAAKVEEEFAL